MDELSTYRYRSPRRVSELRVWAPTARTVDLIVDAGHGPVTVAMAAAPAGGGWWSVPAGSIPADLDVDVAEAAPDGPVVRYGFALDGGDPLPDPRSARQPDGVHGLSALWARDERDRSDTGTGWSGRSVRGAVIYELHIGTFTPEGTLDAAIERLDHLVDLGVDFVEPLPLNAFNGIYNWGYDGVAWYAVHEPYGGPAALVRFVDACHARGLGVILDVVYNHLGPSGNYLPRFGPYLTSGSNTWGSSVNLADADSDEVRRYIVANALRWFDEFGVDALRLDAVHALVDHRAVHLLEELAAATDALSDELGRPLSLIAESDLNDPRLILPRTDGGYGLTAQWDDDIHHAVHAAVSGERQGYYADFGSYAGLAKVLRGGFFHDGTYSSFRRRGHGRPIPTDRVPASALLAYTCNHDQIGNRATGDRPTAYLDGGQLAIKAALVLLSPFTPMLFMGEEWAADTPFRFFTSHPEPELGRATADGRRAEFAEHGWDTDDIPDPQDPETFAASTLDWSELDRPDHARMLAFYRDLIALRRTDETFTRTDFASVDIRYDDRAGWFAMLRHDPGGPDRVVVFCVLGADPVRLPFAIEPILSWHPPEAGTDGTVTSPGHNVIVGRVGAPTLAE
ncbi:malto-oligosyltrehalose trehalohydrolase [Gordonia sinesedis]